MLPPGAGASHRTPYGDELVWKAGEDATGGQFSIHERVAPRGARSTPHAHRQLVEAFYVLDGTCEFVIGDEIVAGKPGTFVLAPRGTLHGWTVTGDGPARMLVFFTPSVKRAFFDRQEELLRSEADAGAFRALAEEFGWT